MSKPSSKKRTIAAIAFDTNTRLKNAAARSKKLYGKRNLSRYIRQLVDADLNPVANP